MATQEQAKKQLQVEGQKIEFGKLNITDQFPGRIELALVHQAANKFGVPNRKSNFKKVCACCDALINVKEVGCCDNFVTLGCDPGIAVLFHFMRTVVIFLILFFILGSSYNLYTNYRANQCGDPKYESLKRCVPSLQIVFSPVNKYVNRTQFANMELFTLLTVLVCILFFIIYRKAHYDVYMQAQEYVQHQEEYTLCVSNIPNVMDELNSSDYQNKIKILFTQKINNWIAKNQIQKDRNSQKASGQNKYQNYPRIYSKYVDHSRLDINAPYNSNPKVVDVHLCWDIRQMEQLNRVKTGVKSNLQAIAQQRQELQKQQSKDQNSQKMLTDNEKQFQKYRKQLTTVNHQYLSLSKEYANKNELGFSENMANFLGKAFVSFQYQHFAQVMRIQMNKKSIKMGDSILRAVWAPSPRDVKWENLSIAYWVRRKKEFISFIIMIGVIFLSFIVQYAVQLGQVNMSASFENKMSDQQKREGQIIMMILGLFGSALTLVTNTIFEKAMSQLKVFEKHESITDEQKSFILKTLISQFINTSLILYVNSILFPQPIFSSQGIVASVATLLVQLAFFKQGTKILMCPILTWKIPMWWNYKNSTLKAQSFQDNLNTQFEMPPYDIGTTYIEYLNNLFMAAFFSYIAPWACLVIALASTVSYFIEKCNLTKYSSLKTHYSYEMSTEALKMFQFTPAVFVLGQILFSYVFYSPSWILWVALALSIIYPIIMNNLPPFLYIRLMSTWMSYEIHSFGYCQAKHKFDYTFQNSNPLTKFNSPLYRRDQYVNLYQAEQFLQKIPPGQATPTPLYNTFRSNTLNQERDQQKNKQQIQQQYQNQSQFGANRSAYGQFYNQGQNYQIGNQYNNFGYQPLSQQGF